jgi:hypothetical protein
MKITKTILRLLLTVTLSANAANVLCIGLNDYEGYPDLKRAESDATAVARVFQGMGHSVTLLSGDSVTSANVMEALAAKPDFVYFAGHGEEGRLMLRDGDVRLSAIADANTMMLLDCCYIGRGLKTSGTMKILAASEQEAFESDGQGLFTKYLVSWLNDGRSVDDAALTRYLEKNIRTETGGWQKPVLGYI